MIRKVLLKHLSAKDDGMTMPLMLGMFMLVIVLFLMFVEAMHFTTTFKQCDDAVERSVIAVATQNWDNVYQGVREGYAGGNVKEGLADPWEVVLDDGDVGRIGELPDPDSILDNASVIDGAVEMLNLDYDDGVWVRKNDDDEVLLSFDPHIVSEITNVDLYDGGVTNVGSGKGLLFKVTYDIAVAWMAPGAWGDAQPIAVTRTVYVKYSPQY